jgi:hypothetical protein
MIYFVPLIDHTERTLFWYAQFPRLPHHGNNCFKRPLSVCLYKVYRIYLSLDNNWQSRTLFARTTIITKCISLMASIYYHYIILLLFKSLEKYYIYIIMMRIYWHQLCWHKENAHQNPNVSVSQYLSQYKSCPFARWRSTVRSGKPRLRF